MRTRTLTNTHRHAHTLSPALFISLSLFHIKTLSGLFSILMWFVILCQHLTSQAVGIRLIQREANRLWLADCRGVKTGITWTEGQTDRMTHRQSPALLTPGVKGH